MSFVGWTRLRDPCDAKANKSLWRVRCSGVAREPSRRMARSQKKWAFRSIRWNAASMNWTGRKWCRYPILVRGRDGSECVPAELGSMLEAVPTSTDDPVTAALSGDRTRVVREAIESLSEQERMVLFLIHVEGLTGSETGSLIGVTESRVSQILSGTRRKLRRYLDRSDAGDLLDFAA